MGFLKKFIRHGQQISNVAEADEAVSCCSDSRENSDDEMESPPTQQLPKPTRKRRKDDSFLVEYLKRKEGIMREGRKVSW